jgi:mitotic spindle assembly checkpoint protein MAD2
MAQKQATRTNQAITLKGSTAMVSEFFEYSVNSILYQRGVYPSDDFRYATTIAYWGLTD